MGYNDLTAPFQGGNDEWNDLEVTINDGGINDLTLSTENVPPGSGEEWNTAM